MPLDAQTDDPALQPLTAFNTDSGALPVTPRVSAAPTQVEDDPALKPLEAFNWSGITPYTPKPSSTMADVGHGLSYGLHTGLGAPLAEITGQTEEAAAERKSGEEAQAAMTPGAEQTPSVWLAEQAAPTVAMVAPSFIPGVGWVASAAMGAAIQGGSAISGNKAAIDQANDMDLMQSNPDYAADRRSGLTEQQAKDKLGQSMALSVGAPSAILGGVMGGAGGAELTGALKVGVGEAENAALTGGSLLTRRVSGRVPSAIVGAGRGLVEQGLPGAAQEQVSKHAEAQEGVGQEATSEDILSAGLGQGLFGAGMAGVGGAWHGGRAPDPTVAKTPDRQQTGGQATIGRRTPAQASTESKRTDGSTPNTTTAPADLPADAAAAGPPPPPPKVDPAQGAALGAGQEASPKAPDVTQGVTKPQPEVVQPGPAETPQPIQPGPQPIAEGVGAPPAGDTTQPLPTPQTGQEAGPAPAPALPREDTAALAPEPDAALAAQHDALIDKTNDRDAMVYPLGSQVFDLPKKGGAYGTTTLPEPDGRTVQYYRYGPNGLRNAEKVQFLYREGKLNDLLGLGPVSKDETLARASAGEPGAVVTERRPDGTPVKSAVGTTATAPEQAAHLEATKTPGSTVHVEDMAAALADRQARVEQEQAVQPEVATTPARQEEAPVTQGVKPDPLAGATKLDENKFGNALYRMSDESHAVVKPDGSIFPIPDGQARAMFPKAFGETPKVLPSLDKASVEAERAAKLHDYEKEQAAINKRLEDEKADTEKRSHKAKEDQAILAGHNIAADKVVATHARVGSYADDNTMGRARKIVAAAKVAGIDVPKVFAEGHPYHPSMLKIREAMDLIRPQKDAEGHTLPQSERLARFIDREHMIDTNRADEAYAARREEGKLGLGSPEGAAEVGIKKKGARIDADEAAEQTGEHIVPSEAGEEHAIAETVGAHEEGETELPTGYTSEGEHEEAPPEKDAFTLAREERESKLAAARAESEAMRKEAQEREPPKAAMGFKQEVRKSRALKRYMDEDGAVTVKDHSGKDVSVNPTRSSTAEEAIKEHYDPKAYAPEQHQANQHLIDSVNKIAGDTPVHYLSKEDIEQTFGKGTKGVYDPNRHQIFLAEGADQQTALHETFHAATSAAFEDNPEFQRAIERLNDEVYNSREYQSLSAADKASIRYPMSDPEEFITGMMTNPKMQQFLRGVKISDQLARDIGIPKWRKMTAWHGVLHAIQKALGLGPRDVSAIEGAMSISQQAMWRHPRGVGDLMEAVGRGERAERAAPVSLPKLRFSREDPPEEQLTEGKAPARWGAASDQATNSIKALVKDAPMIGRAAGQTATATLRHLIETPRDWVARAKEKNWGLADASRRWANEMGAQSATRERIVKLSTPVMDRLMAFQHTNAADFKTLGKLFIDSTIHGADARDDLGTGKNAHINMNPKGGIENAPKEHWEAIKGSPEDRAAYKSLPKEGQKLYDDTMDELSQMHDRETAAGRQALIDGVHNSLTREGNNIPADRKAAITKVLNGEELTGEERATHGEDDSIRAIHDYDAMAAKSKRGVYFPLDHGDGSDVVNGEHDYEIPEGATRFSENPDSPDYHRILFDNKKDAFNFQPRNPAGNLLPVEHYTVEGEHHAVVNPREVQFVNGNIEGERARAHMLAPVEQGGLGMDPKKVTQVQPRKNQEIWRQSQNSNMVREQIKRLDKMPDLTDSDRERMADAIKHVAASSMPGTRFRSTLLERDRTGGAGQDILKDLDKYRRRSAGMQAAARHRATIDKAMQEMHEFADGNRGHPDAGAIQQMVNMFDQRTNGFIKDESGDSNTSKRWAAVQAYNALEGLVTPAFHLLHQLHVPLTVIPDLAAESNGATAARIASGVYSRMGGGQTATAFKSMGRALVKGWRYDHKPTNFVEAMANEMKMTPSERETLQWQLDHDTIQHTGMDFSHANAGSSGLAQASARMRNFSAEFIGSADASNKLNSMLMYHQLGVEKGLSGEALHQYVGDGIVRTQGQFASWNKANAFKTPMARALLQYKQYPIKLMNMHAKAMYNSFAPTRHPTTGKLGYHAADWETRARALKTFGYMTLAAAAMSGAKGAVAWPIRLADDLGQKLGITDGYQAHMDELQRGLANTFGTTGANTLMNGLGAPFGLNIGHRGSISDPLGIAYLMETAGKDPDASIFKWIAGAPGSTVHNVFSGIDAAKNGDVAGMATHLLPRIIGDPIKGWQQANQGVTTAKGKAISPPVSIPQSVLKGIGFQNLTETNVHEAQALQKQEATDKTAVIQKAASNPALIGPWNRAHPHDRITVQQALKARQQTKINKPKTLKQKQMEEDYSVYQ
jgi:hypothetical protein